MRLPIIALAVAAACSSVGAQTIRGVVMLPDSSRAAGAIVVATKVSGGEPVRALTGAKGEYSLRMREPGRYAVSVLRIGFRPTLVPAFDIAAGETQTLSIVLRSDPIVLARINVKDTSACRVNPDSGLAVAQAWNEARNAILTTELSSSVDPLIAKRIDYDRTLDATAQFIRKQSIRTSETPTAHAFKSLPADTLAARGFAIDNARGTMFYAPDADVLLSGSFAALHCFRLVAPSPPLAGLIGVHFEPTRPRKGVRDIAGTFWVDQTTAELRFLDYQYTNLPEVMPSGEARGRVQFLRLATGEWLVDRWNVRVPELGVSDQAVMTGLSRKYTAAHPAVVGVQVTGGEIVRVMRGDTLLYEAAGDTLSVQIVSRDSVVPVAGAMLTLEGTDYGATADASGRITLAPVLEGPYVARVESALMDSLGIESVEHSVDVRAKTHVDSILLPLSSDIVRRVCPNDSVRHGEGMLRGVVRDEHGIALKQAAVSVSWQGEFSLGVDVIAWNNRTLGALTDDHGRWRICGVARDRNLVVRVVSDSGVDSRIAAVAPDRAFTTIDLVARPGASAADPRFAGSRALVEIAVYGTGGAPLPDATLEVTARGQARTLVTGSGGRALVPDVIPGALRVRVKRIGYKPGDVVANVEAGRNTVPIHLSATLPPTLQSVRIIGDKQMLDPRDGFDVRRLQGFGTFVTEEDLARHPSPVLADVLGRIKDVHLERGVVVGPGKSGVPMPYLRGSVTGYCLPNVFVDGTLLMSIKSDPSLVAGKPSVVDRNDIVSQFQDLSLAVHPERITGIEVYSNSGNMPPQYDRTSYNACGSIVIWTRK